MSHEPNGVVLVVGPTEKVNEQGGDGRKEDRIRIRRTRVEHERWR